jgi:hypothetical protein
MAEERDSRQRAQPIHLSTSQPQAPLPSQPVSATLPRSYNHDISSHAASLPAEHSQEWHGSRYYTDEDLYRGRGSPGTGWTDRSVYNSDAYEGGIASTNVSVGDLPSAGRTKS